MTAGGRGYLWQVTVTLLAVAIIAGGVFWLSQSSLLAVESIEVSGNQSLSDEQVMEVIGPYLYGQSLLKYSFDDAGDALREIPLVEHVDIKRDFPNTVRVDIREYHPVASYAGEEGTYFFLAGDGRVLATAAEPDPALPVLETGEACTAAVGDNMGCEDVRTGLLFITSVPVSLNQEFNMVEVSGGMIEASSPNGIQVRFGTMDEFAYKFEVLRQLIARSVAAGEQVIIDVSVPDRPVLRAKGQLQTEDDDGAEAAGDEEAVLEDGEGMPEDTGEPLVEEDYQDGTGEAWVE